MSAEQQTEPFDEKLKAMLVEAEAEVTAINNQITKFQTKVSELKRDLVVATKNVDQARRAVAAIEPPPPPSLPAPSVQGKHHQCPFCPQTFPYNSYLERHIMRSHKGQVVKAAAAAAPIVAEPANLPVSKLPPVPRPSINRVPLAQPVPAGPPYVKPEDSVKGKNIAFTGTCPGHPDRSTLEEEVVKRGGMVVPMVSPNTDFLVVGEEPGRTKVEAATQHSVKCINTAELCAKLGLALPARGSGTKPLPRMDKRFIPRWEGQIHKALELIGQKGWVSSEISEIFGDSRKEYFLRRMLEFLPPRDPVLHGRCHRALVPTEMTALAHKIALAVPRNLADARRAEIDVMVPQILSEVI